MFASRLKARRTWAAIALIVLGSLTALVAGAGGVASGIQALRNSDDTRPGYLTGQLVGLGFIGIVLVSSILLVVYASQSIRAIEVLRNVGEGGPMGFQPVMSPYAPGYGVPPPYGAPPPHVPPYAPPPVPGGQGSDD